MEKEPLPRLIKTLYFSSRNYFAARFGDALPDPDITFYEGSIVNFVVSEEKEEGVSASDLMERYHVSKSSMSETMKRLVEKGYVSIRVSSLDKRKKGYFPTEKAKGHVEKMRPIFEQFDAEIESALSEEETKEFYRLANKLLLNMEGGKR